MTHLPILAAAASQARVPQTSITGWASQTPGSSGAQSRHRARPLGAIPALPIANPGIQSAYVPMELKTKGFQRRAPKPALDTHPSPHGPAVEAAVAADVGVPKIQEGHTPFLLTSDEHSVGPQVRALCIMSRVFSCAKQED